MKKIISLTLALVLTFALAACSTKTPEESMPPDYCDDDFLQDFTAGLVARWDLTSQADAKDNRDKSEREWHTELVRSELDKIEHYRTGLFEDPKLQERAIAYINLLQDQLDALTYINTDNSRYTDMWSTAYDKRTQMITAFITDYNLQFPEAYAETVADMMTNARIVTEKNELDQKVQQMVDSLQFELVQNDYGLKTYRAIIQNTTDQAFLHFSVEVGLINADGILIRTEYASADNIAPGQKAYLEFMTDAEFSNYELHLGYYDLAQ